MDVEIERAEAIVAHCPRHVLVEHVMRRTRDDFDVIAFTDVEPLSDAYMQALGRLLVDSPGPLLSGTPLAVWAGGGVLRPDWRDSEPPVPRSVWGEYETLKRLLGTSFQPVGSCPLEELNFLRELV